MASSLARTLYRPLLSNPLTKSHTATNIKLSSLSYCTNSSRNASDLEEVNVSDSPLDSVPEVEGSERPASVEYSLEKGLDYGIYKVLHSFILTISSFKGLHSFIFKMY